ncbi:MAG: hypothetical protein IJ752_00785 [Alphaproteobacteria bacterium]|nr:hypothetical protein [Alphaproteobacteria bacterium]
MKKIHFFNPSEKIDRFFDFLSGKPADKVLSCCDIFSKAGLRGLFVIPILITILMIVWHIRYAVSAGFCLFFILLSIIGCILFHYAAFTMLPALNALIKNAPTKISSAGILRVTALFVGGFGLLILFYGISSIFAAKRIELFGLVLAEIRNVFFLSVFVFICCEFWLFLLLKPSALNVEVVEKTSVGEEFIGLTTYFAKGCLKLTPVIFGTSITCACILLVLMMFHVDLASQMRTVILLCGMAFLPFLMYVAFLSYYFALDIVMAVLSIPGKLDRLKKD